MLKASTEGVYFSLHLLLPSTEQANAANALFIRRSEEKSKNNDKVIQNLIKAALHPRASRARDAFFSLLFLLIIPFFYDKRYDEVRSTRAITLSHNFCFSFTRSTESLERHAIQLPLHTSNKPTHTYIFFQLFSWMRTCRQRTWQELMKELFMRSTCILLPYFFTQ